jgi:hypothetical protein
MIKKNEEEMIRIEGIINKIEIMEIDMEKKMDYSRS